MDKFHKRTCYSGGSIVEMVPPNDYLKFGTRRANTARCLSFVVKYLLFAAICQTCVACKDDDVGQRRIEQNHRQSDTQQVVKDRLSGQIEAVNEILYNHSRDGLNIRSAALTSSRKIGVLPYGSRVVSHEKWENRTLIDSESTWYHIKFGKLDGWVSGLYLSIWPPAYDYVNFKGGCIDHCELGPVRFRPDHSFKMYIGFTGWGKGRWRTQPDGIHVEVTMVHSCTEECVGMMMAEYKVSVAEAVKKFELENTYSANLRFFQNRTGALEIEVTNTNRPDWIQKDLPERPLGKMVPYKSDGE